MSCLDFFDVALLLWAFEPYLVLWADSRGWSLNPTCLKHTYKIGTLTDLCVFRIQNVKEISSAYDECDPMHRERLKRQIMKHYIEEMDQHAERIAVMKGFMDHMNTGEGLDPVKVGKVKQDIIAQAKKWDEFEYIKDGQRKK